MIKKLPNVIQVVIAALERGNFFLSIHAQEQMVIRDVQMSDVEEMIYRAYREESKDSLTKDKKSWKYSLRGVNDDGDKDIRIIIVLNDGDAVVVTVIDKNKKED